MARTRAQTAAQQGLPSPVDPPITVQSRDRKRKHSVDNVENVLESQANPALKRQRISLTDNAPLKPVIDSSTATRIDPVAFWVHTGRWPEEQNWPEETPETEYTMAHILARKKSLSSLSRKRSNSATSTTPSDQKPREEKSALYRDPRYKTLLETKGSFMAKSDLGITDQSRALCHELLDTAQSEPPHSLFRSDIFESTCRRVEDRNEARIIRDITPWIVPSAEILCTYGANHLEHLIESVNEGWNNSVPLTGTRPQPDYSVGFRRSAFTEDQLTKLSPFIGDFIAGDQSLFMATFYMYFPFLTCEVKCAGALDVADRQNAHSMTLAVRAIVELFRVLEREDEVNRQILAFSISHDHRMVRIYGHYPVINGKDVKFYRHPIHTFDFTALDGIDKWTAYRFTKNVYDIWLPAHFAKICSAVDQLPSDLDFDVPPLSETTGLSQNLGHLMQSDSDVGSVPLEEGTQSSNAEQHAVTPGTSFTRPEGSKRRKG